MNSPVNYETTSRFVQVGSERIHYHDAGDGPPLLCIHGGAPGAFGWGNFGRNVAALSQYFRVLVVDLPGYGKSGKPQIEVDRNGFYAKTFCEFLSALGLSRANVLGMATGGAVAMRMAIDAPQSVQNLILVSAAGGLAIYHVKPVQTASQAYYAGSGPSLEKMRAYLEQLLYDPALITEDVLRERYEASVDPEFQHQAPEGRTKVRHTPSDLWKKLDLIQAPTLILWGRENRAQNLESAVFMHSRIRDSQLHVFGQCGLWVPYEKADEFNHQVISFLQRRSC